MILELLLPDRIGNLSIGAGVAIHAGRQTGENLIRPLMGRIGAFRGEKFPSGIGSVNQHAGAKQVVMFPLFRTYLTEKRRCQSLVNSCSPDIINSKMTKNARFDVAVGIDMKILAAAG